MIDLRLPDGTGLELAAEVRSQGLVTSLVLVSGYASVRVAVQAVHGGVIDVLEKPFVPGDILATVARGVALCRNRQAELSQHQLARLRLASLSQSEREVLDLVMLGLPNKVIARTLGLGLRTVESRKAQLYQKVGAGSVAELIRIALAAGFEPGTTRQAESREAADPALIAVR